MTKILCVICFMFLTACFTNTKKSADSQILGKQLSFQRNKGNCLACHSIENGEEPGNIGPALVNMQQRFVKKSELKALMWDATQFNDKTSMPPFGRNKILTAKELDAVVDYIWSL